MSAATKGIPDSISPETKWTLRASLSSLAINSVARWPLAIVEGPAPFGPITAFTAFDLDEIGEQLVIIAQEARDRRLLSVEAESRASLIGGADARTTHKVRQCPFPRTVHCVDMDER
jgi:hypothetical protein